MRYHQCIGVQPKSASSAGISDPYIVICRDRFQRTLSPTGFYKDSRIVKAFMFLSARTKTRHSGESGPALAVLGTTSGTARTPSSPRWISSNSIYRDMKMCEVGRALTSINWPHICASWECHLGGWHDQPRRWKISSCAIEKRSKISICNTTRPRFCGGERRRPTTERTFIAV